MESREYRPSFHGTGGEFFWICAKNVLLTVVTFGIYWLWAKTNIRRYLYSQTELEGERFVYHGTGEELFRGWLKAVGLMIAILAVIGIASALIDSPLVLLGIYPVIVFFIFPLALLGARRYRLSRTSWCNVRFSFRGEYGEFLGVFIPGVLLCIITLGLYFPFFHMNVRRYLVERSRYGDTAFDFDGKGGEVFGRFLLMVLLIVPTLGIYYFWYSAWRHRYYWSHTSLGGARFESSVTGGGLFVLVLLNALITAVTFGIGTPWAMVRVSQFHCDNIRLVGSVDFSRIRQDAKPANATGEELSGMFDLDLVGADFFGI